MGGRPSFLDTLHEKLSSGKTVRCFTDQWRTATAYSALPEMVAALLRRPGTLLGQVISAGNVSLDVEHHQVTIAGQVHAFRLREAVLLEILLRHRGAVVPRRYVEDQLFGVDGEQDSNTIEVYVHRLRKHLLDIGATIRIHTIRGVGYLLSEDPARRNEN